MPRQARIDYPGALHHVIVRGINGKYIFKETEEKKEFYTRLKDLKEKSSVQIYAWCLMSNHFHILIQTGKTSLSEFMRSLLTGYALNYNKRHKRKGYVFQNRYKSIICDRDEYLLPLVRYIHLNPVKTRMIMISELLSYRWTGYRETVGGGAQVLIEHEEVLGFFGQKSKEAIEGYKEYMNEGLSLKEDYSGGGLIRSLGGMEAVVGMKQDERQLSDERILGDGSFVENVLSQIEEEEREQKPFKDVDDLLERISRYYDVKKDAILKTKTLAVRAPRNVFVFLAGTYLGLYASDAGRLLGISQSASSKALSRGREIVEREGILKKLREVELS